MKCDKCGALKAVYDDGVACMEKCAGVLQFSQIVVEEMDDKKVVRVSGERVKRMVRQAYQQQIVGDYGAKRLNTETKIKTRTKVRLK